MSPSQRFLHQVSVLKGYDGEINQEVFEEAEKLSRQMTTPAIGDEVIIFNGVQENGVIKSYSGQDSWVVEVSGQTRTLGTRDFVLKKMLDMQAELEMAT